MQAIVQHRYGGPEVLRLEDVQRPAPGPGEVLVRVHASSIFFGDWRLMRGSPFIMRLATGLRRPRNPVPGLDLAGSVEAIGDGVTEIAPGDEVFGWAAGSLAEFVCTPASQLVRKPATLSFEEAAAVPEAAMTALQGIRDHARVEAGQRVLVIGASGGVGTFAVQIAKALGATVTGVASTRNLELVRSIGADDVVDYTHADVTRLDERRYDAIFQAAGTQSPMALRRILTPEGTLVLSNGQGRFAGIDRIIAATLVDPFVRQRLVVFMTRENRDDLLAVRELIESGAVRPVIDRTYRLADAADAMRYLEAGHTRGKIVITPAASEAAHHA
jgi:2-desacetyl-2-hydroxyethyl bacteriochlorophyllide A dehydrogenase